MTEFTKVNPFFSTAARVETTNTQKAKYLIYCFFGALEVLLVFRLFLKLIGASVASTFVRLIYGLAGLLNMPFEGIFHRSYSQGLETVSTLEPSILVAIIVYGLLAWGMLKLVQSGS